MFSLDDSSQSLFLKKGPRGRQRAPWTRTFYTEGMEHSKYVEERNGGFYGAIAFYLAQEQDVDANICEGEEEIQRSLPPLSESRPELYDWLDRARHEISPRDLAKH